MIEALMVGPNKVKVWVYPRIGEDPEKEEKEIREIPAANREKVGKYYYITDPKRFICHKFIKKALRSYHRQYQFRF